MILGHIQETSFYFSIWVSVHSIPGTFTLINCLLNWVLQHIYGFGYFLLSIHLFLPSLYNFGVSIMCYWFGFSCGLWQPIWKEQAKKWRENLCHPSKSEILSIRSGLSLKYNPAGLQVVWISLFFLTQVSFKTLYEEKSLVFCCGCLPPSESCNGLLPLWFIMVSHLLLASVQDAVHF